MRQPARSDARDNRERILAAARLAFAGEGLDVPIREIARRAQVGAATVYRHFPTKEALLSAALADRMTLCSSVVEEGLAAADPWDGFCQVVDTLIRVHAVDDRGFSRAVTARLPAAAGAAADRDRTLRLFARLVERAKKTGFLRADFELEDLVFALMANEGIRAESLRTREAASRRVAALMIQSFQAHPVAAPLPPAVRLPLTVR